MKYNASLLQILETNLQTLTRMGTVIGLLVLIAAMLLVFNTIRLTVYARRDVIKAMKLVGATNRFIRAPFVIEGILQGLLAGGISASVLHLSFERLLPKLSPRVRFIGLAIWTMVLLNRSYGDFICTIRLAWKSLGCRNFYSKNSTLTQKNSM